MLKKNLLSLILILVSFFFLAAPTVKAATGTITGSSAYAWGENIGWLNFKADSSNISVTDSGLTGYVWSDNYGWINLSPSNGGVSNTCAGVLGGHAWSTTLGWISFSGASINNDGKFTGLIGNSSSTVGRITFDCDNCGVYTDWRPSCDLPNTQSSTSDSGNEFSVSEYVCDAGKPSSAPVLVSADAGENQVTLTWEPAADPKTHYLVAYGTAPDQIEYGNPNVGGADTSSYVVEGLSAGRTYYFQVKAVNDCMPGDFSNSLAAAPRGVAYEQDRIAENFIPSQLFDIQLNILNPVSNLVGDLSAQVVFQNFGTDPTPIELVYRIEDSQSQEVWSKSETVTVETELTHNIDFGDLKLSPGEYSLILNTDYNQGVKDIFVKKFEITAASGIVSLSTSFIKSWWWLSLLALLLLLILIRRRKDEEN